MRVAGDQDPAAAMMGAARAWVVGLGLGLGLAACGSPPAIKQGAAEAEAAVVPTEPARGPGWLKGQLHLHSSASGDSETPPGDVVRWYAEHGYDFIVFTDHNRITQVPGPEGLLVMPGIELTQNLERCEPPSPAHPPRSAYDRHAYNARQTHHGSRAIRRDRLHGRVERSAE